MTIPMELHLGKGEFESFSDLEESIFDAVMEAGRELYQRILSGLDEEILARRDKTQYRNKGLRKTCMKTRMGEVEYSRRVYEHRNENGHIESVYLLDEELGKQTIGMVSMKVCQMAVEAVTESTYRTSARQISEQTGLRLSHQAVWNITQKLGKVREEEIVHLSQEAKAARGQGSLISKILYEEMDGIWLKLQGADRAERGQGAELKLAIAYDGARWIESGKRKRRILDNKVANAGFCTVKEFMEQTEGVIAGHYAVDEIELRVRNGDGANWINHGTGSEHINVLDKFHRNRAIYEGINDADLRKTMITLLYEHKIDDLLLCMEAAIESTLDKAEQEKRRDLYEYFLKNRDGLDDYYHRDIEVPPTRAPEIHHARLGSMESNIFTIIGNRMKGRRACWSIRGAGHLAHLLCLKYTTGLSDLFSRTETGWERKTGEEYIQPLSAGRAPTRSGKGYEAACRGSLPINLRHILNLSPLV